MALKLPAYGREVLYSCTGCGAHRLSARRMVVLGTVYEVVSEVVKEVEDEVVAVYERYAWSS